MYRGFCGSDCFNGVLGCHMVLFFREHGGLALGIAQANALVMFLDFSSKKPLPLLLRLLQLQRLLLLRQHMFVGA